jgi:uncharacterized protein (TIGR02145 family)
MSGGVITNPGDSPIIQKGVCWSSSPNPTISDNYTNDGTGAESFSSQLSELSSSTTYYVRAYASNSEATVYGEQKVFTTSEGGITVVEVLNPITGKVWMDRNLGASRAALTSLDYEAFGDLYQWGRDTDGHEKRNSGITGTLSNNDVPGHGEFIVVQNTPYDWRSPQNDNLWQGVNGTNNPCPTGYRVATNAEWDSERQSWISNNAEGAFASPLKLVVAGYRSGSSDGSIGSVGSYGHYWTSTIAGIEARTLTFYNNNALMYNYSRVEGFTVRCLKN